ncbi:hypothetical protein D3C75_1199720 [compost metagenome]
MGDREQLVFIAHRRERAAGRDQRGTVGPVDDVFRAGFHARGRVGQRHDDRTRTMLVHFADQLFGKQARLAGNADQNARFGVTHYVQQRDSVAGGLP